MAKITTHEEYINEIARLACAFGGNETRNLLSRCKLSYGVGATRGARGATHHNSWTCPEGSEVAHVEIAARYEENPVQLAGTTIHELAHVLCGPGIGHAPLWKEACNRLGLIKCDAAGTVYEPDNFDPQLLKYLEKVPTPADGTPNWFDAATGAAVMLPRPCSMGIGTRGGTSRGPGSGSRMIKAVCQSDGYTVRLTRKWAERGMPHCGICAQRMGFDS